MAAGVLQQCAAAEDSVGTSKPLHANENHRSGWMHLRQASHIGMQTPTAIPATWKVQTFAMLHATLGQRPHQASHRAAPATQAPAAGALLCMHPGAPSARRTCEG